MRSWWILSEELNPRRAHGAGALAMEAGRPGRAPTAVNQASLQ
jgi:hypothetical protein